MLEPLMSVLKDMRIVLASSSKQRIALLESTGLKFEICPSNYEEDLDPKKHTFSEFVELTALNKLNEVWERLKHDLKPPDVIIGMDTMVTHNGTMFGKPKNKEDAIRIIRTLTQSGIPNVVYTGVAIKYHQSVHTFTETTTVYMDKLEEEEILAYVESGEPMGKAGGYGIQGVASTFVRRIEGDFNNVVGLPLSRLAREIKKMINRKTLQF